MHRSARATAAIRASLAAQEAASDTPGKAPEAETRGPEVGGEAPRFASGRFVFLSCKRVLLVLSQRVSLSLNVCQFTAVCGF